MTTPIPRTLKGQGTTETEAVVRWFKNLVWLDAAPGVLVAVLTTEKLYSLVLSPTKTHYTAYLVEDQDTIELGTGDTILQAAKHILHYVEEQERQS